MDDELGRIGSLINQAQAQQTLGLYRQSHHTLEAVGRSLESQSDPQIQAIGWRSLGNVKRVIGDLTESQQMLTRSLTAAQRLSFLCSHRYCLFRVRQYSSSPGAGGCCSPVLPEGSSIFPLSHPIARAAQSATIVR